MALPIGSTHTHTQEGNKYKCLPSQKESDQTLINVSAFLKELRKELDLTIDEFVSVMGWKNTKYYAKIVNGYFLKDEKRFSNPTINYVFGGLNHAFTYYNEKVFDKKETILNLINKYFLYFLSNSY